MKGDIIYSLPRVGTSDYITVNTTSNTLNIANIKLGQQLKLVCTANTTLTISNGTFSNNSVIPSSTSTTIPMVAGDIVTLIKNSSNTLLIDMRTVSNGGSSAGVVYLGSATGSPVTFTANTNSANSSIGFTPASGVTGGTWSSPWFNPAVDGLYRFDIFAKTNQYDTGGSTSRDLLQFQINSTWESPANGDISKYRYALNTPISGGTLRTQIMEASFIIPLLASESYGIGAFQASFPANKTVNWSFDLYKLS